MLVQNKLQTLNCLLEEKNKKKKKKVRTSFIPSTITTAITDPARVGSKATAVTPEPHVVVAADWAAASGLTYAEKFETGEQYRGTESPMFFSVSFFPCFARDNRWSCQQNKYAAKGAKPSQLGGICGGTPDFVLVIGHDWKPFPGPGVTSQTTMVDGLTIGTPATCMAPLSVMIASPAIMPLGPQPKSPLLVWNHLGVESFWLGGHWDQWSWTEPDENTEQTQRKLGHRAEIKQLHASDTQGFNI